MEKGKRARFCRVCSSLALSVFFTIALYGNDLIPFTFYTFSRKGSEVSTDWLQLDYRQPSEQSYLISDDIANLVITLYSHIRTGGVDFSDFSGENQGGSGTWIPNQG